MPIIDYQDYLDAGWHIFPLHPIIDGRCGCGNAECKNAGKHPVMSNWQHVTTWDEEQIAYFTGEDGHSDRNQFLDGFGVNLAGKRLLVIDVDARNGGVEALKRLPLDLISNSGFIVRTGSGNGSMHIYTQIPESWVDKGLLTNLRNYPGIDFKSTGFVVGCGSMHLSGDRYEAIRGGPADVTETPLELLEMLRRPDRMRSTFEGSVAEYSMVELSGIVDAIQNRGRDYERWIRVGMAIHHATSGSSEGFDLWMRWSQRSDAHDPNDMDYKWHSFGKNPQDQVTIGTLLVWAREDGYSAPVSFTCDDPELTVEDSVVSAEVRESVNLKRPPGLVGAVTEWVNSRSIFPRHHLAVAAAIFIVSNAAGLRYRVDKWETTLNQFVFGIAGSGTGKDSVLGSIMEAHTAVGISGALVGKLKSEQELTRNLLRNQAAFYAIDEFGQELRKLGNAVKKGGSPYLEGIMGALMSVYSKASGVLPLGGDIKHELIESISREIAAVTKRIDAGHDEEERLNNLKAQIRQANEGIKDPFLSLYGTGEPTVFGGAVDREMMTAGFMNRALVVEEKDNVPERVDMETYRKEPLPMGLKLRLAALYNGGTTPGDRVERHGDIVYIRWSPEAYKAQEDIYHYWRNKARESQDNGHSLESTLNRALELTVKLAATLAVESGVITMEHMRYAHALIYKSTMWKVYKLQADDGAERDATIETRSDGVLAAIRSLIDKKEEIQIGGLVNRYRNKYTREQLQEGLDWMVQQGDVIVTPRTRKNGQTYNYYKLA